MLLIEIKISLIKSRTIAVFIPILQGFKIVIII